MTILEDKPIFIGGLWRSGTSLMRAVIASHPEVAIIEYDLKLWTLFYIDSLLRDLRSTAAQEHLVDRVLRQRKVKKMTVPLEREQILARIRQHEYVDHGVVIGEILREYARQLGRSRWGLKTPQNEFVTDELFAAYPGAKFVQMIRDPRDVLASSAKWFKKGDRDALRTRFLWQRSVELSQRNMALYPDSYIAVRYEDLVTEPEQWVRRICDVLEIEFVPEMLTMRQFPRSASANTSYGDVPTSVMTKAPVGRYTKHLTPVETAFFHPVVQRYGYPIEDVMLTSEDKAVLKQMERRAAFDRTQRAILSRLDTGAPCMELLTVRERRVWIMRYWRRRLLGYAKRTRVS